MPYVSPRSRHALVFRVMIWSGSVIGAGLLAWAVYAVAKMGPKDAAEMPGAEVKAGMNAEQRQIADEVAAIEQQLRQSGAPALSESGRRAQLSRAIGLQRQLLQLNRNLGREENDRLERLEAERDTRRAQEIFARIGELEQTAETEQQAGRPAEATGPWREALHLQQEINRSGAAARYKDFVRETRLTLQLETAEATPLRQRVDEATARAEAAAQRQDWPAVLAAKTEAREALAELNQRWPKSRLADLSRHDALVKEVASLEAAGAVAEVEAREKGADAAAAAGRAAMAAELYQSAAEVQRAVNRTHGGSRFASTRRLEELEVKRQTVLAVELLEQVAVADRAARDLLFKRQVANASAKVAEAAAVLDKIETEFPKSRVTDGALKLKLAYLGRRRADLRALQDEFYARLLPVPEAPNRLLLRTEVTQELYAKVMNTNPSRNAGRARPVDSVDWAGAQEFCVRVSWLLGATVRLPTEREFRHALGGGEGAAWTAENSGGQSREVGAGATATNANGFSDLLGNLAEWLQGDAEATAAGVTAPVAGGSYLDESAVVQAVPVIAVEKTTRVRHIGFRVVVEFPLQ